MNSNRASKIGIVGATGAVGQELIRLLVDRDFPCAEIRLYASARSAGKTTTYAGKTYTIEEARAEIFEELDLAIFSAGSGTTKTLAPEAVRRGCVVVDNSSAFRMDADTPLVIPCINRDAIRGHKGIIANPNCSTAIALMGLAPLHRAFGLKRFFASTYQAVSGTGWKAMVELENQVKAHVNGGESEPEVYPYPIAFNLLPHVDVFLDNGYTKEEVKMLAESQKILDLPELRVSTTCVRVPVMRCHSVAISAEFERPVDVAVAQKAVAEFDGAVLVDDPANNRYPLPLEWAGKEDCAVGRIRVDSALDNGLALWVAGDQLWRGAALNAVEIAEAVVADGLLMHKSNSAV